MSVNNEYLFVFYFSLFFGDLFFFILKLLGGWVYFGGWGGFVVWGGLSIYVAEFTLFF